MLWVKGSTELARLQKGGRARRARLAVARAITGLHGDGLARYRLVHSHNVGFMLVEMEAKAYSIA